jgi:hypothetical protein
VRELHELGNINEGDLMVIRGHVKNGVIVPEQPDKLPEGAEVRVELIQPTPEKPLQRRQGGRWKDMVQTVLNDEQVKQIEEAAEPVVFVNARGIPVAYASTSFSPEEIAEAHRRAQSDGPWYTTEEVVRFIESQVGLA